MAPGRAPRLHRPCPAPLRPANGRRGLSQCCCPGPWTATRTVHFTSDAKQVSQRRRSPLAGIRVLKQSNFDHLVDGHIHFGIAATRASHFVRLLMRHACPVKLNSERPRRCPPPTGWSRGAPPEQQQLRSPGTHEPPPKSLQRQPVADFGARRYIHTAVTQQQRAYPPVFNFASATPYIELACYEEGVRHGHTAHCGKRRSN